MEEIDALETLDRIVPECGIPFLFDLASYRVSCSKEKSNELMASIGVPLPQPWPECGFPIIVKPSSAVIIVLSIYSVRHPFFRR